MVVEANQRERGEKKPCESERVKVVASRKFSPKKTFFFFLSKLFVLLPPI